MKIKVLKKMTAFLAATMLWAFAPLVSRKTSRRTTWRASMKSSRRTRN